MEYYYNPKKKNTAAHIWKYGDTYCKMLSTGGMRAGAKQVREHHDGRRICVMCQNVFDRTLLKNMNAVKVISKHTDTQLNS